MPAQAGIQFDSWRWLPACAGTSGFVGYAASAFAGFAGGVMAPDVLMSANSLAE